MYFLLLKKTHTYFGSLATKGGLKAIFDKRSIIKVVNSAVQE